MVFNVCNFVAPALVARAVFDAVGEAGPGEWALGAAAAIGAFLALHYGLLASVLRLARGVAVRDTVPPPADPVRRGRAPPPRRPRRHPLSAAPRELVFHGTS